MAEEENIGSRYAYLLQPAKDLEKNFAIDITSILEEYTKQLNELAADEDFQRDNAHRFNFAEAAMLVHGTANVFCKKVDLVHNQALNFFEVFKVSKEKKKKKDDDEGIGDDDDGNEDPFVTAPMDPCVLLNFTNLKPANPESLVSKAAHHTIPSISIMPMSLMPLADFEKCNVPIYNPKNKNEVVGKKDDYKINTGYMSKTGALLLDLLNERLIDIFVKKNRCNTTEADDDSGRGSPNSFDVDIELPPFSQDYDPGRPSNAIEIVRRTAGPSLEGNILINRASSFNLIPDMKASQPLAALEEEQPIADFGDTFDENSIPFDLPVKKKKPWEYDEDNDIDPLIDKIEDPFEESTWKHKPYKESNNVMNVAAIIAKKNTDLEKKQAKEKIMEIIEYVNDHIYGRCRKPKVKRELGLGAQYKWEVDAIIPYINTQQKEREKVRRELLARQKLEVKESNPRNGRQQPPEPAVVEYNEDDDFAAGGYDDDPCGNRDHNRFVNSEVVPRPLMAEVADDDLAGDINFPAIFVGLGTQNSNDLPTNIEMDVEKDIHDQMSVDQIIVFYRKKFWEQTAEAMSKLAARVQEWDERMQPILEEEEKRKEFNIHEYGDELLALFNKVEEEKDLPQLLRNKKSYEISRYFLSTLMMANTMNVEIVNEQQGGPDPLKMVRLRLLKRDRHHDVFDQSAAL